jgi:hypothetical protein
VAVASDQGKRKEERREIGEWKVGGLGLAVDSGQRAGFSTGIVKVRKIDPEEQS